MKPPSPLKKLFNDPEMKAFLKRGEAEMFPKVQESAVCMMLYTDKIDAKIALELGAIILLDKPLVLIAEKNTPIPARLLRIADAVIDLTDWKANPAKAQRTITDALEKIQQRYPEGKRTATP
jgi:hypothetical protein